ncbi:FAD-binding protein [Phenylobacterium sp.]|uniref:FAD-dependent oxidoreductase n=1 Tax=Phenylobacterium sp. TaxID=1871053 RepID=UPI0035AED214
MLRNPYFIGDQPGLTQSSGWVDAWTSAPSAYVVKARDAADVAKAIGFASAHRLRLVVKGGGHSYLGGSSAPDSLLVWTRDMDAIQLHDRFVPSGCSTAPTPAVSVGAGCLWGHVYDAVTTRAGRYVQGGGCATVGVAGLVQGGGFGNFSKAYGLAAAGLLEAEVVTADGQVRVVNASRDPDLFWALKGGGGGTFGVVTRLTLQTHDLPPTFGAFRWTLAAKSDDAFRRLLARFLEEYSTNLFNPHWGEQVRATGDNRLIVEMVFQGLDREAAVSAWQGLAEFVAASPQDFEEVSPRLAVVLPARNFWDAAYLKANLPGAITSDDRPGADPGNWWWTGDGAQAWRCWHGFSSAWLPTTLLRGDGPARLARSWFAASRHWSTALHFNKGLAGASKATLAASRDTAINPEVLDAFALAIIAGDGPSGGAGLPEPDLVKARKDAVSIRTAMTELRTAAPDAGCYLSEMDYFNPDWRRACWGANWDRLSRIKRRYDPDGLFIVHHGVGSEAWSEDGFARARTG